MQAKYPSAKLVQWEPVNRDSSRIASKAAFGEYTDAQYKLENADVILSLDADFLQSNAFPGFLPLSAAYAERHAFEAGKTMNRLYVVESMPSVTGAKAEHRLGLKPSDIDKFATALANGGSYAGDEYGQKYFAALLADLKKAGSKAVVIPGETASCRARCGLRTQCTARCRRVHRHLHAAHRRDPYRADGRLPQSRRSDEVRPGEDPRHPWWQPDLQRPL